MGIGNIVMKSFWSEVQDLNLRLRSASKIDLPGRPCGPLGTDLVRQSGQKTFPQCRQWLLRLARDAWKPCLQLLHSSTSSSCCQRTWKKTNWKCKPGGLNCRDIIFQTVEIATLDQDYVKNQDLRVSRVSRCRFLNCKDWFNQDHVETNRDTWLMKC